MRPLRIVIVGGGVAGLTLAALLRQRDLDPIVVERAPGYGQVGYGLALWPLGVSVLHGLRRYAAYEQVSGPMGTYVIRDASGALLARYDLGELGHGRELRTVTRWDLLDVLRGAAPANTPALYPVEVRTGTTVVDVVDGGDGLDVALSDGDQLDVDVLVGADGIHSSIRRFVVGEVPLRRSGHSAFTWWTAVDPGLESHLVEFWGTGATVGFYGLPGRAGWAAVLPTNDGSQSDAEYLTQHLSDFSAVPVRGARDGLGASAVIDSFPLDDVVIRRWHCGRIVLIGDAAAPFLPTAGIGASMAMESAAVLADELSRATADSAPRALRFYEQRRRARVDAIQAQSRQILSAMTLRNRLLVGARNVTVKKLPPFAVFGPILRYADTGI